MFLNILSFPALLSYTFYVTVFGIAARFFVFSITVEFCLFLANSLFVVVYVVVSKSLQMCFSVCSVYDPYSFFIFFYHVVQCLIL